MICENHQNTASDEESVGVQIEMRTLFPARTRFALHVRTQPVCIAGFIHLASRELENGLRCSFFACYETHTVQFEE